MILGILQIVVQISKDLPDLRRQVPVAPQVIEVFCLPSSVHLCKWNVLDGVLGEAGGGGGVGGDGEQEEGCFRKMLEHKYFYLNDYLSLVEFLNFAPASFIYLKQRLFKYSYLLI